MAGIIQRIGSWGGGSLAYIEEKKHVSGLTHTWRLWRHCCCRYGWYPLLVAPIATAGCLLSIYSSLGCDFIRVNVGFTPSNDGWNQSTAEFGIFMFQSGELEDDTNDIQRTFLEGCQWYPDDFEAEFIESDRTWKTTEIMGYVSGVSSIIAMITAWLFVITPIPAYFFWPGFLLPSLMCAFLTEGSKFLIFDTSVCRSTAWYPSGADSLPRVARECKLGATGTYTIASVSLFFLCLILVCLKAPEKRELKPFYGTDSEPEDSTYEGNHMFGQQPPQPIYYPEDQPSYDVHGAIPRQIVSTSPRRLHFTPNSRNTFYDPDEDQNEYADDVPWPEEEQEDNLVSSRMKTLDPALDRLATKPIQEMDDSDEENGDLYKPKKIDQDPPTVSESRLHTIEKMKRNTGNSDDLIQKFVSEINNCFEMETRTQKMNPTNVISPQTNEGKKEVHPAAALSF